MVLGGSLHWIFQRYYYRIITCFNLKKISIPLPSPLLFIIFASVVCSCAQSWNVFLIVVKKVYHKYEEGEPQLCASFVDKLSAEGRTLLCVRKTYALPNESRYFA